MVLLAPHLWIKYASCILTIVTTWRKKVSFKINFLNDAHHTWNSVKNNVTLFTHVLYHYLWSSFCNCTYMFLVLLLKSKWGQMLSFNEQKGNQLIFFVKVVFLISSTTFIMYTMVTNSPSRRNSIAFYEHVIQPLLSPNLN